MLLNISLLLYHRISRSRQQEVKQYSELNDFTGELLNIFGQDKVIEIDFSVENNLIVD